MEKKKRFAIIGFIIGFVVLVAGVTFLLLRFLGGDSGVQDGDYLVEKRTWVLDSAGDADPVSEAAITNCANDAETNCAPVPGVIWEFTEIGKGTLTTNNHLNDYSFIWALEDGKLKIETNWLYPLDNEFDYELDQGSSKLKLIDGDRIYYFVSLGN